MNNKQFQLRAKEYMLKLQHDMGVDFIKYSGCSDAALVSKSTYNDIKAEVIIMLESHDDDIDVVSARITIKSFAGGTVEVDMKPENKGIQLIDCINKFREYVRRYLTNIIQLNKYNKFVGNMNLFYDDDCSDLPEQYEDIEHVAATMALYSVFDTHYRIVEFTP